MGTRDDRIDAYIAAASEFARPILTHLRAIVHEACPDVEETMKWSFPHFQYEGMLCSMAAFKEHAAFNFWKGALIVEKGGAAVEQAMGQFGRVRGVSDLPSKKVLIGYIHQAMKLNEDGVKSPTRTKPKDAPARDVVVPDDLARRLGEVAAALTTFERFSPSNQREYIDWINEARTEATRGRRLEQAVEWMAEGKTRNWKYMKC